MSDNWVGPGWWMASDGKWYPPRTPTGGDLAGSLHHDESASDPSNQRVPEMARQSAVSETVDSSESTRWSRTTPDGRPVVGATELSDAERSAELAATRAERAATISLPEPVSIKRPEDHALGADEAEAPDADDVDAQAAVTDVAENDAVIERDLPIDLRSSEVSEDSEDMHSSAAAHSSAPDGTLNGSVERSGHDADDADDAADADDAHAAELAVAAPAESDQLGVGPTPDALPFPNTEELPLQHAVLPALVEQEPPSRSRKGLVLLALATALAITCGVLGALLLQERSENADLSTELEQATAADEAAELGVVDVSELNDEVRILTLQNEQLQAQLNDMSALVLELPEGRVTEIVVPFTPVFADEENGRFIAMSSEGEYVVWADGADGVITDSGQLSGSPTGLFAAARKAWISTDADLIEIVSLTNEEGLPSVEFGPALFLAAEERAYWTYHEGNRDVVRLRKGDGGVTATVPVPVPVVDLTIGAGSVWALGEDGRVYRINTADFTVQGIDAGVDLISITAGPDALWTLSAADGSLRRVDPVTGDVLVTVPVGRDPIDATFAGSSVWVALRSGTSLIEVDTRTAAVVSRTALPGTPTALHQGDSGVFVTLEGEVPLVRVASSTLPSPEGDDETSGESSDEG